MLRPSGHTRAGPAVRSESENALMVTVTQGRDPRAHRRRPLSGLRAPGPAWQG